MGAARDLVFHILAIDGASAVFERVGAAAEGAAAKTEAASAKTEESSAAAASGTKVSAMALAGLAAGAGYVAYKSIEMASKFQTSMNTLVTSAGESPKALGLVGNGIKSLAVQTATGTQELTSGMYMLES